MDTTARYSQWLKIDLFGDLSFEKIADCVILLAQAIKMPPNVVFYVQRVVQMEQFMLVLLKCMGPGIIMVCHTTTHALCNIQQLSKNLPLSMPLCNCILKLDSACSSPLTMHFFAHRVFILWNSSSLIDLCYFWTSFTSKVHIQGMAALHVLSLTDKVHEQAPQHNVSHNHDPT